MKFNRRKAMGIALGGAMAGPSVAKKAAEHIMNYGSTADKSIREVNQYMYGKKQENTVHLKEQLLSEKNYLTKLINGELDNFQWLDERTLSNELIGRNIDSLKSVSQTSKHLMYSFELEKRYVQSRIEDAKQRLPEIIKRLAGL